jgi:spermidine synthase
MTDRPRVELLRDLDRPTGWVLLVDGVEQSYVDEDDATHLEFEYMQHFAVVLDEVLPRPAAVSAVHLGGGALTVPRWLAATRPGSDQVVVESSAEVLRVAERLGPVPGCRLVVDDAAAALAGLGGGRGEPLGWEMREG